MRGYDPRDYTKYDTGFSYASMPPLRNEPRHYGTAGHMWRLFRHMPIPRHIENMAEWDRSAAIGMLFSESTLKNDAAYQVELIWVKTWLQEAFGIGGGIWKEWCYKKGLDQDPVFNKIVWYLAWMVEKSRIINTGPMNRTRIGMPEVYPIIKDIRGINDPGFKALSDLLGKWSGRPPEPPRDELAFDPTELAQNAHRFGLKHQLAHPDQPLSKPRRYPDPSSSAPLATGYPPRPGPVDPMAISDWAAEILRRS
jgi:hypothetical protein